MNLSTDLKPDTYLGLKAGELLQQLNDHRRPIMITQNGEPVAIMQDLKSYELMRNTIVMLQQRCKRES